MKHHPQRHALATRGKVQYSENGLSLSQDMLVRAEPLLLDTRPPVGYLGGEGLLDSNKGLCLDTAEELERMVRVDQGKSPCWALDPEEG